MNNKDAIQVNWMYPSVHNYTKTSKTKCTVQEVLTYVLTTSLIEFQDLWIGRYLFTGEFIDLPTCWEININTTPKYTIHSHTNR